MPKQTSNNKKDWSWSNGMKMSKSRDVIEAWANSDDVSDRVYAVHNADEMIDIRCKLYDDPEERVRNEARYYLSSRFSVLIRAANEVMRKYDETTIFDHKSLEKYYNEVLWTYIRAECDKMDSQGTPHTEEFENGNEILEHYNFWLSEMDKLIKEGYKNRKIDLRDITLDL